MGLYEAASLRRYARDDIDIDDIADIRPQLLHKVVEKAVTCLKSVLKLQTFIFGNNIKLYAFYIFLKTTWLNNYDLFILLRFKYQHR